jgi:transcriptional regulator with PAS, ATPase and Fis domain
MQALYNSKFPILIQGETGTGKTFLAKKIHKSSKHKNNSFIHCNLAGLSESLFDSELFGHTKGSFTGAIENKLGYCDLVGEGTLFFDEIGDISLIQQKKLLQILDNGDFYSVGNTNLKRFLGRFIFATHRNLECLVREGKFREDLFFRLGGLAINLKPFNRKNLDEKIQYIDQKFIEIFEKYNLVKTKVTSSCLETMADYPWPGNYREIEKTIELIVLKNEGTRIDKHLLSEKFSIKSIKEGELRRQISSLERKIILNEVVNKGIGINKAAKSLGISKTTLIAKLRKYGISGHSLKQNSQLRIA